MSLVITAGERDALYDQILDRLSGIGDIELAIQLENYEAAEDLRQEYADELVLLGDLGVGPSDGDKEVELTTPPDVLRRALPRLRDLARALVASQDPAWVELCDLRKRTKLVAEACGNVLATLDHEDPDT